MLTMPQSKRRQVNLQVMQSCVNTIVAAAVAVATELTLSWNHIMDVQDLGSAGQLIPLVIGGGLIIRVMYIGIFRKGKGKEQPESDDEAVHADSFANMPTSGGYYGGAGKPDPVYHFPAQSAPYSEPDGLDRFPAPSSAPRW
jgi:hypothetical protein